MRARPEPGTRVRCDNRSGTVVAPDGRRAAAYRKERRGTVDDRRHAYVQWDDSHGLCLVLLPVLQPLGEDAAGIAKAAEGGDG